MSILLELALLVVGFALGILWFNVTILPVFYGVPRAFFWAARGWTKWYAALHYLSAPVIVALIFPGLALLLVEFLPAAANYVRSSFGFWLGSTFGILLSFGRAIFDKFSDIHKDFLGFMRPYLTPKGLNATGILHQSD